MSSSYDKIDARHWDIHMSQGLHLRGWQTGG